MNIKILVMAIIATSPCLTAKRFTVTNNTNKTFFFRAIQKNVMIPQIHAYTVPPKSSQSYDLSGEYCFNFYHDKKHQNPVGDDCSSIYEKDELCITQQPDGRTTIDCKK